MSIEFISPAKRLRAWIGEDVPRSVRVVAPLASDRAAALEVLWGMDPMWHYCFLAGRYRPGGGSLDVTLPTVQAVAPFPDSFAWVAGQHPSLTYYSHQARDLRDSLATAFEHLGITTGLVQIDAVGTSPEGSSPAIMRGASYALAVVLVGTADGSLPEGSVLMSKVGHGFKAQF